MSQEEKAILSVAGLVAAGLLILYLLKRQQANALLSANQPGLYGQMNPPSISQTASYAGSQAVGGVIATVGNGLSGWLGGLFGNNSVASGYGSNSDNANDPGLEYSAAGDFSESDWSDAQGTLADAYAY